MLRKTCVCTYAVTHCANIAICYTKYVYFAYKYAHNFALNRLTMSVKCCYGHHHLFVFSR